MDTINYLTLSEKRRSAVMERLRVRWCEMMHDSLTWPRNGCYRCRTCGRCYAVPWHEGDRLRAYAAARQPADRRAPVTAAA